MAIEARARLLADIRRYFADRNVLEVETPVLSRAGNNDPNIQSIATDSPRPKFLRTSPEYAMKRLLASGLGDIYELGRVFRAGEKGQHHNPEFTMLEWYRANATSDDVIRDTEELVEVCARTVGEVSPFSRPWPRATVEEALERHAGVRLEALSNDDERFYRIWAVDVQPKLGKEQPTVVTDWPASMASLAKLKPNGMADRFEAFYRGVELCNGFGELTDAAEQRRRFERDRAEREAAGSSVYPMDEELLDALARGMPESGGNALGVDRLLMLLVGAASIQDVMLFPEERL